MVVVLNVLQINSSKANGAKTVVKTVSRAIQMDATFVTTALFYKVT